MRKIIIAAAFVLPGIVGAESEIWTDLDGGGITSFLTGSLVTYDGARQDFRASGRTLYTTSEEQWGYWGVRGDQYCSMWPPSDLWSCYDVARKGDMVRFIGGSGDTTDGTVQPMPE